MEDDKRYLDVDWPPLQDGHNEPGPTDTAGEYRGAGEPPPPPARVPGQVRPHEQPLDIASETVIPPEVPEEEMTAAERDVDDVRHIARGKPSMSSSEGSS